MQALDARALEPDGGPALIARNRAATHHAQARQ
jgi:hypothetical protein